MIQVFQKIYENKFMTEVTYFFHLQNYGANPKFEVVHETVSDYTHYFSKYVVFLNHYPKNTDKVEVMLLRFSPAVFSNFKTKRRLAILTKFAFYLMFQNNDIPITKAIDKVIYHNNGEEIILSPNAFLKSYYRLVPIFSQILQESKSI